MNKTRRSQHIRSCDDRVVAPVSPSKVRALELMCGLYEQFEKRSTYTCSHHHCINYALSSIIDGTMELQTAYTGNCLLPGS